MPSLVGHIDVLRAVASHRDWILSTFRGQIARLEDVGKFAARTESDALRRVMCCSAGLVVVAVPRGHIDDLLGWAVSLDDRLMFAYVREPLRHKGIGGQLIAEAVTAAPVQVAYWTPDAESMQARGYPIAYSIKAHRSLLAFARESKPLEERQVA
jgi:GNAT superfamily N-acetyltransferase